MSKPQKMTPALRKHAARLRAEMKKEDPLWLPRFRKLEAELLKSKPHLAEQKFCTGDKPARRVVLPNGQVLWSTWYKVPTSEADAKLAAREQAWLIEQSRKARR